MNSIDKTTDSNNDGAASLGTVTSYCAENLTLRADGKYGCPSCGGPLQLDGEGRWLCFSCGERGRLPELVGMVEGIADLSARERRVAELLHGDADAAVMSAATPREAATGVGARAEADPNCGLPGLPDGRGFVSECQSRIDDSAAAMALSALGVTAQEAHAWGLGYDPATGSVVVPWAGSARHYAQVRPDGAGGSTATVASGESHPVWNPRALTERAYLVVASPLDALVAQSLGHAAVATCGEEPNDFAHRLSGERATGTAILMPGCVGGKERDRDALGNALMGLGIEHWTPDDGDVPADAAPARLCAMDRTRLARILNHIYGKAVEDRTLRKEREYLDALARGRRLDVTGVLEGIDDLAHPTDRIPTGFPALDEALDGGLPPYGLVTVGALTSVGKTTFALQVADTIAASGRKVMLFLTEQSGQEIVSKSISRLMYGSRYRGSGRRIMASQENVTNAAERARWRESDPEKQAAYEYAVNAYWRQIAPNVSIVESSGLNARDVRTFVEAEMERGWEAPFVVVDYMQQLEAVDERDSDRRAVDRNATLLRRMSRDLNTPVLAISSINRSSYSEGVMLESFKESGSIEFSTDVLVGLQPRGMKERVDGAGEKDRRAEARRVMDAYKDSRDREVELVVLKNRAGAVHTQGVPMRYNAVANCFS